MYVYVCPRVCVHQCMDGWMHVMHVFMYAVYVL